MRQRRVLTRKQVSTVQCSAGLGYGMLKKVFKIELIHEKCRQKERKYCINQDYFSAFILFKTSTLFSSILFLFFPNIFLSFLVFYKTPPPRPFINKFYRKQKAFQQRNIYIYKGKVRTKVKRGKGRQRHPTIIWHLLNIFQNIIFTSILFSQLFNNFYRIEIINIKYRNN